MDQGRVYLLNKRMRCRTQQYIELQALNDSVKARSAVLDGEVVCLKEGRPSFPAVMKRDRTANAAAIKHLSSVLPITYMVFDILFFNGKDLRKETLTHRQNVLRSIVTGNYCLHRVESFQDGISLFDAVKDMGLEGVVAKNKSGIYHNGKHHNDWFKIKCFQYQNCLVGGYTMRGRLVNSLLLGAYREKGLSYLGRASAGLNTAQQELLSQQLPALDIAHSPFADLSKVPPGGHFVQPELGLRVEYLEWTEDLKLRSPVIKEFIDTRKEDFQVI
jgi:bifunctional non-homologous end joining protein LigD